jgi:uncharacterized membrane protein YsdA (DUF1294 family)
MSNFDKIALAWFSGWNLASFFAFDFDKWRAGRSGQRVSEATLALLGALGGWPGGFAGMKVFRHKTAKWTFKLKYALTVIPFVTEVWAWLHWR